MIMPKRRPNAKKVTKVFIKNVGDSMMYRVGIKSSLCFSFLTLMAFAQLLHVGCSESPSKQVKQQQNEAEKNDIVRRWHRKTDNPTRSGFDVTDSVPKSVGSPSNELNSLKLVSAQILIDDTTPKEMAMESNGQTFAFETPPSLPKSIDWSLPSEKAAKAEDNIASVDAGVESVVTVDAGTQTASENPFAIIAESQTIADTDAIANTDAKVNSDTTVNSNAVITLPDVDSSEDVWQQDSDENESLESMEIKKSDYDEAAGMFRTVPGVRNNQDAKDETQTNSSQTVEPQESNEDVWQVTESSDAASDMIEEEANIELTIVPTLPNVQSEDDDPFGMKATEAAEQFGQTADADTSKSTSDDEGFSFDDTDNFWETSESDSGTISQPGQRTTPATSTSATPATETSAQTGTSTGQRTTQNAMAGTLPEGAELTKLETLTPVEEYLINEANTSPVKLMESVELLCKLNKPLTVRRLLRNFIEADVTTEDYQQITKRVNPSLLVRLGNDEAYQPEGTHAVRKIVEGSKSYFESRQVIENAMQTLLSGTDRQKEDAMRTILNGGETSIEYLLERLAASDNRKELSEINGLLRSMGDSSRRALQESLFTAMPLRMRAAQLLTNMGRASDARFLMPMMFDSRLTEAERSEVTKMVRELSGNVPSQEKVAATMYSMATSYFRGNVSFMTDANHNVPLWLFREDAEMPKFVTLGEADASRYFAEKFARFATSLDPRKPAHRQLWLVTFFDLKGAELGSDNSIKLDEALLKTMIRGLSIDEVDSALRMAMQQDHPIAARMAAELLGEFDDVEEVIYKRGSQGALVRAAGFSDRRVRFAAINSIMKLNPDRPYPGSSVVSQSLVFFTRATGKKRAVVVCPWVSDATAIANLLGPLGYTTETATMGRQAMQLAIDSADTEVMLLDVRTPNSDVAFLVQDMRADNRTHDVPVAVMANGWRVSRAERASYGKNRVVPQEPITPVVQESTISQDDQESQVLQVAQNTPNSQSWAIPQNVSQHPTDKNRFFIGDDEFVVHGDQMTRAERAAYGSKMAHAFPRPYDEASAKFVLDNLFRETGVEHVPPHIRLAEAKQSILWVAELYRQPKLYRFENIEEIAAMTLWEPELMLETLAIVESIPTPAAQQMMTQIVSTSSFPIAIRQSALQSFEKNARNNGVLIRGRQILNLYDGYNASASEPIASQQTRSDLLDVVEKYANYTQNVGYK